MYSDIAAAAPPILVVLAFKIFIARPLERQFKYYNPTPQEAEDEWHAAMSEKRTHHRDMEKRFLHPALQNSELFTVMVHKKQEALARDVMAAYPWFNPKAVAEVRISAVSSLEIYANPPIIAGPSRIRPKPRSCE